MIRKLLAGAVASAALTILPAQAQQTRPPQTPPAEAKSTDAKIDEVVVTARRREESMQEVPIAITAYSAEDLRASNVTRMENLGSVVAGLTISTTNNRPSVPAFAIRGQRNDTAFMTNDPSVGIYVAEAVQARVYGLGQSLFDLESVQVLKGPQGTLFGRNTTGGAILFQPRRPRLGQFEGYVEGRGGDLGRADIQGAISLPLGERTALRLAANRTHRDGYIRELNLGEKLNEEDTLSGRAVLLMQPTDRFVDTLYVDYFDSDQVGSGTRLTAVNPAGQGQARYDVLAQLARLSALPFLQVENDVPALSTGRNLGFTNVAQFDISDRLMVKNILNYRTIKMFERQDLDGTALPLISTVDAQETDQYSGELQLQGTTESQRLKWIMGVYYFREDGERMTLTSTLGGVPAPRSGSSVSDSHSVFAQGDFNLTNALTLTLGARYTWDGRQFEQRLLSATTGLCTFCASREADFTAPTYTASLSWKLAPDRLLYVATRRGYRSGGFNSSGNNAPALEPFKPEDVTDYEIGYKSDWRFEGGLLRANLAAYHSDYNEIQRSIIGQVAGVPVTSIFNAASATIQGAEAELTYLAGESFELIATTAYTHPKYDEFFEQTAGGPVDRSMNTFAYIPEWTYRLGMRVRLPFGGQGESWLRADYSWQDEVYHSEFNDARNLQKAYGLLTARLDFNDVLRPGLDVGLYGTNLTDEKYFISTGDQWTGLGIVYRGLSEPRTWGVNLRYRF